MARKARLHVPGGFYHVIMRGNAHRDVFHQDRDRLYICDLLEEGMTRFGHRIHAFCLMTNHIHLLIQVDQVSLSKIMHNVTFRYTRWINRKYGLCGHIFQGRYRAILVDTDAHLLELARYIHLNPVRSGHVESPRAYRWSSHLVYLGARKCAWVTTDFMLSMFADRVADARRMYEKFVDEGMTEGTRPEFRGEGMTDDRILGDDTFASDVLKQAGGCLGKPASLHDVVSRVCEFYGLGLEEIASRGRSRKLSEVRHVLALLVRETEALSLVDLGRLLHRDRTTLSHAARRLERRLERDKQLAGRVNNLKRIMYQMTT